MKKLKTSETAMVKQKAPGLKQIELCADGKYRWIYEFNMLKNPTIFFTVLNIFGVLILVQVFLMVILGLKDGDSLPDVLKSAGSWVILWLPLATIGSTWCCSRWTTKASCIGN